MATSKKLASKSSASKKTANKAIHAALHERERIFQFIPLHVSDGTRKAVLSLSQSNELTQFIENPENAPTIDTEDRSIGTLALDALSRDDVIVPSTSAPVSVELSVADFVRLTSEREIEAMGRVWKVQVNPQALSRMMAGRTATILATDGQNVALLRVRLIKGGKKENLAPLPAIDEVLVRRSDLPRFLDNPLVPGTRKMPYRVKLTQHQSTDFLEYGAVTINVGQGRTFSLVVAPDDVTDVNSGLSFRRDVWSPLRTTRTLGVMSRGDLASAKSIEEAAHEDYQTLLNRMRDNLGFETGSSVLNGQQQIGLILPWNQSVEFREQVQGRRVSTVTLLPGEVRRTQLDASNSSAQTVMDKSRLAKFSTSLTVNVANGNLDLENLDRSAQDFAQALIQGINVRDTSPKDSFGDGAGKSRFANPSDTALMQVDTFGAFNIANVSVDVDMGSAQLGVFLPNPFLTLSFDTDTILRYSAILSDNVMDHSLRSGFKALGGLSARREVVRPKPQPIAPTKSKCDDKSSAGPAKEAALSSAAKDQEAQLSRLITQAKASLSQVQNLAGRVLNAEHESGALRAFASIGNRNAADVLGVPYGSARSEDLLAARKWLASRVMSRRFQAVHACLVDLADADISSDEAVYEWGERFMSAVPTPMKMFELVNISNESTGIIREIVQPLLQSVAVNSLILESWWQRLTMIGLLSPEDYGLTRALERLIANYVVVLDLDAESVETGVSDQNELRLARELLRHIRDNGDYYAGVVFANQPKRTQVALMQSIVQRIAPDIPGQVFDFDRMWIVDQNIVLGLNHYGLEAASKLLESIRVNAPQMQSQTCVIPIDGVSHRSSFIDIQKSNE